MTLTLTASKTGGYAGAKAAPARPAADAIENAFNAGTACNEAIQDTVHQYGVDIDANEWKHIPAFRVYRRALSGKTLHEATLSVIDALKKAMFHSVRYHDPVKGRDQAVKLTYGHFVPVERAKQFDEDIRKLIELDADLVAETLEVTLPDEKSGQVAVAVRNICATLAREVKAVREAAEEITPEPQSRAALFCAIAAGMRRVYRIETPEPEAETEKVSG